MLHLQLNADGFLKDGHNGAWAEAPGVFLAGTATGPQSILECIAEATQSVRQVRHYLEAKHMNLPDALKPVNVLVMHGPELVAAGLDPQDFSQAVAELAELPGVCL